MPFESCPAERFHFVDHNGRRYAFYHIYKNDDVTNCLTRDYDFGLWPYAQDDDPDGENGKFDLRELPGRKNYDLDTDNGKVMFLEALVKDGYFDSEFDMDVYGEEIIHPGDDTEGHWRTTTLAPRQRDTILAALRYWQARRVSDEAFTGSWSPFWEHGEPLTSEEIDKLCEEINR